MATEQNTQSNVITQLDIIGMIVHYKLHDITQPCCLRLICISDKYYVAYSIHSISLNRCIT